MVHLDALVRNSKIEIFCHGTNPVSLIRHNLKRKMLCSAGFFLSLISDMDVLGQNDDINQDETVQEHNNEEKEPDIDESNSESKSVVINNGNVNVVQFIIHNRLNEFRDQPLD